jgi:leucyl aminopeptidase (aminopeptidase T)
MSVFETEIKAVHHLLSHCGNLVAGESCLLVVDATTKNLTEFFIGQAKQIKANLQILEVEVADRHGKEPKSEVAEAMTQSDLVIGFTKMSIAHTKARQNLCQNGGRYLSLPGFSRQLLTDPCIQADFKGQFQLTKAITEAFSAGSTVQAKTAAGTDVRLGIEGRIGNCCPGFVNDNYNLGSPPDIESNVSPVENLSEGVAVIDGSVACDEIGLLEVPLTLHIAGGRVVKVTSSRQDYVEKVNHLFARINNPKAYVLAECGIGLNPLAKLTGNMLTDEGCMGNVHFGFGSNITVGGQNDVPFHVDFIMKDASLWIDDIQILNAGKPCLLDLI